MAAPAVQPATAAAEAFAARCLLRAARQAVLATQSEGQPYASLVTPAVTPEGAVLILISGLAVHTRHLMAEPRCALMVTGAAADPANPQTAPRLTLIGRAAPVADAALRRFWVSRHPYAFYADFTDFGLWRLTAETGHFVAGFGRAHLIPAGQLRPAAEAAEALAAEVPALLARLAGANRPGLARLAAARGLHGKWDVLGVDVDGLDVIQDDVTARIAFDAPVGTAGEALAALQRLDEAAR